MPVPQPIGDSWRTCTGLPRPAPVLERPLHTERLSLRPATAGDAEATWEYRRLESVNHWLTGCPADVDGYRELFTEPGQPLIVYELMFGKAQTEPCPIARATGLRPTSTWPTTRERCGSITATESGGTGASVCDDARRRCATEGRLTPATTGDSSAIGTRSWWCRWRCC